MNDKQNILQLLIFVVSLNTITLTLQYYIIYKSNIVLKSNETKTNHIPRLLGMRVFPENQHNKIK